MKIKTERLNVQDHFGDCKLDYNTVHVIVHGVHSYCLVRSIAIHWVARVLHDSAFISNCGGQNHGERIHIDKL